MPDLDLRLLFELVCAACAGISAIIACRHVRVAREQQKQAALSERDAREHLHRARLAEQTAAEHRERAEAAEAEARLHRGQIAQCEARLLEAEHRVSDAAQSVQHWRDAIQQAFFYSMERDNGPKTRG